MRLAAKQLVDLVRGHPAALHEIGSEGFGFGGAALEIGEDKFVQLRRLEHLTFAQEVDQCCGGRDPFHRLRVRDGGGKRSAATSVRWRRREGSERWVPSGLPLGGQLGFYPPQALD